MNQKSLPSSSSKPLNSNAPAFVPGQSFVRETKSEGRNEVSKVKKSNKGKPNEKKTKRSKKKNYKKKEPQKLIGPLGGVAPKPGAFYTETFKDRPVTLERVPFLAPSSSGAVEEKESSTVQHTIWKSYTFDAALYEAEDGIRSVEDLEKLDAAELTAVLERQKEKTNPSKSRKKKKKEKTNRMEEQKNTASGWWRRLSEGNIDPISLEPLNQLNYPPFSLFEDNTKTEPDTAPPQIARKYSRDRTAGENLFDGAVLANFVVSTGHFINPLSRTPLSRDDCQRLDIYLKRHSLKKMKVAESFDISKKVSPNGNFNETTSETRRRATRQQPSREQSSTDRLRQREATVLLSNLFTYDRHDDEVGEVSTSDQTSISDLSRRQRDELLLSQQQESGWPSLGNARNREEEGNEGEFGRFNYNRREHGEEGMRVIDDDEWQQDDRIFVEGAVAGSRAENFPTMERRETKSEETKNEELSWRTRNRRVRRGSFKAEKPLSWAKVKSSVDANKPTVFRRSEAAENSAGDRQRRKLKLLPRSSTTPSSHEQSSNSSSIFGGGRQRTEVLEENGVDWREKELDQVDCVVAQRILCPYAPSTLRFACKNRQWISRIENRLIEFIKTPASQRRMTPPLEPMNRDKRVIVHLICDHFGLQTQSLDRGAARYTEVQKGPGNRKPPVPLATAAIAFSNLLQFIDTMETNSGKTVKSTRRAAGGGVLHFEGLTVGGGARVTPEQFHACLTQYTGARRSEYNVTWLDADCRHLLVEFAQKQRARRVLTQLSEKTGTTTHIKLGIVRFSVQWFGGDTKWALKQLSAIRMIEGKKEGKNIVVGPAQLPNQSQKVTSEEKVQEAIRRAEGDWAGSREKAKPMEKVREGIRVNENDNAYGFLDSEEDGDDDSSGESEAERNKKGDAEGTAVTTSKYITTEWSCAMCTFINRAGRDYCEMCGNSK